MGRSVAIVVGLFAVITTSMAQLPLTTRDFKLQIATGETITLSAPAATAGYSLSLPTTRGTSGYLLSADGAGGMLWVNPNVTMWSLSGNSELDSTSTFIGSIDEAVGRPLILKTDGSERLRIMGGSGFVGIGTSSASYMLDVAGTLGASGLATMSGGLTLTGTTLINSTGTSATTIGNTSASTAVTINSGSTGRLTLGGLPVQTSTSDDIVLINSSNQVSRITKQNLVNSSGWGLSGNTGTDSTTTYIGTQDEDVDRPLIVRTAGTERARFAGGSGYAGFATSAPNLQVDIDGGFATRPTTVSATSATTAVTVGNRSMIVITSDDVFASRRVTLSDGLQSGQRLVMIVLGSGGNTTYGVRLLTSDSNMRLSGDVGLEDGDTIELVWYSGNWFELKRSANDD